MTAAAFVQGCFTEIGNPGKEQIVSARFRIDYDKPPEKSPETAPKTSARGNGRSPDSLRIQAFSFNVVEVNYTALDGAQGRIWKVPDSLGKRVDFTGADREAVLPPIAVPSTDYSILKLENRIPRHTVLDPDTVAFGNFSHGAYIKGVAYYSGNPIRFLCQFTDDYKINLVYSRDILELWRQGGSYSFDFVFYAAKWASGTDLTGIVPVTGPDGNFVLIDQEHNPEIFDALKASFFKSFNSTSVWKENPAR
ncbi:MAG: hypothetical protein ABIW76_17815 [Fibrobacteria bacterium]